jgi:hypothetical protein
MKLLQPKRNPESQKKKKTKTLKPKKKKREKKTFVLLKASFSSLKASS